MEKKLAKFYDGAAWKTVCEVVVKVFDGTSWQQIREGDAIFQDGVWYAVACTLLPTVMSGEPTHPVPAIGKYGIDWAVYSVDSSGTPVPVTSNLVIDFTIKEYNADKSIVRNSYTDKVTILAGESKALHRTEHIQETYNYDVEFIIHLKNTLYNRSNVYMSTVNVPLSDDPSGPSMG